MQNAGDSNTKVSDKQRNITRPVSLSVYIGINRELSVWKMSAYWISSKSKIYDTKVIYCILLVYSKLYPIYPICYLFGVIGFYFIFKIHFGVQIKCGLLTLSLGLLSMSREQALAEQFQQPDCCRHSHRPQPVNCAAANRADLTRQQY